MSRLGARMVAFAGYDMPVQYPSGIIKEHLHTRAAAGLFDVSHMGQIAVRPRSGRCADALRALETLVPGDMLGLAAGRQRYTVLTNAAGGVLDDLMVANQGDRLLLVVNAGNKAADEAHLRAHMADACLVEPLADRALLALQGPKAEAVLAALAPEIEAMRFMDMRSVTLLDHRCFISRSGYTGEDGFEISIGASEAEAFCDALLRQRGGRAGRARCPRQPAARSGSLPAWLGPGRDDHAGGGCAGVDGCQSAPSRWSARRWLSRRRGDPAATFARGPPADALDCGRKDERRSAVALRCSSQENAGATAGTVTSGGFGVSLGAPVAMGYVPAAAAGPGTRMFAEVRGRRLPVVVAELPFVPTRYKHHQP